MLPCKGSVGYRELLDKTFVANLSVRNCSGTTWGRARSESSRCNAEGRGLDGVE